MPLRRGGSSRWPHLGCGPRFPSGRCSGGWGRSYSRALHRKRVRNSIRGAPSAGRSGERTTNSADGSWSSSLAVRPAAHGLLRSSSFASSRSENSATSKATRRQRVQRLMMDCRVVPVIDRSGHPRAVCHEPGRCARTRRTPGTEAGSPEGFLGGDGARNGAATRTLPSC